MKVLFLGTSSGITSKHSYHSACLIYGINSKILFDAGDGISRALLSNNISYNEIDSIIISHFHPDHFSGLASLITQMKLTGRTKPLNVYFHKSHRDNLISFLNMSYLFTETMNFPLRLISFEEGAEVQIAQTMKFIARKNNHISNKHNLNKSGISFQSHSFIFSEVEKNLFITSDLGSAVDLHLFDDIPFENIIVEATHIGINEIIDFSAGRGIKNVYITHYDEEQKADILAHIEKISRGTPTFKLAEQGLLAEL